MGILKNIFYFIIEIFKMLIDIVRFLLSDIVYLLRSLLRDIVYLLRSLLRLFFTVVVFDGFIEVADKFFTEIDDFVHNRKVASKNIKKVKFLSKEAFVYGGQLSIFNIIGCLDLRIIIMIHIMVFIMYFTVICCNMVPESVISLIKKHPKASYYLASCGWLPYFIVIDVLLMIIFNYARITRYSFEYFSFGIFVLSVIISFIIAFIRQKLNKA